MATNSRLPSTGSFDNEKYDSYKGDRFNALRGAAGVATASSSVGVGSHESTSETMDSASAVALTVATGGVHSDTRRTHKHHDPNVNDYNDYPGYHPLHHPFCRNYHRTLGSEEGSLDELHGSAHHSSVSALSSWRAINYFDDGTPYCLWGSMEGDGGSPSLEKLTLDSELSLLPTPRQHGLSLGSVAITGESASNPPVAVGSLLRSVSSSLTSLPSYSPGLYHSMSADDNAGFAETPTTPTGAGDTDFPFSPIDAASPQAAVPRRDSKAEVGEHNVRPYWALEARQRGVNAVALHGPRDPAAAGLLLHTAERALETVLHCPIVLDLVGDSAGGTYLVRDEPAPTAAHGGDGVKPRLTAVEKLLPARAVFKPCDEEIGQDYNPHGNVNSDRNQTFIPGSGSRREVLAYALDHGGFAGVPPTMEVVNRYHPGSRHSLISGKHSHQASSRGTKKNTDESALPERIGSLQLFVPQTVAAADVLPGKFSVDEVHALAIFDIRTLNGDRHGGNVLVSYSAVSNGAPDAPHLIPIDHSYICPSGFSDPEYEWLMWTQSKKPFSQRSLDYIAALDAKADAELVRRSLLSVSDSCVEGMSTPLGSASCASTDSTWISISSKYSKKKPKRRAFEDEVAATSAADVLMCTTRLLQIAALEYGASAYDIGSLCRRQRLTVPCFLENLIGAARKPWHWSLDLERFEEMVHEALQGGISNLLDEGEVGPY